MRTYNDNRWKRPRDERAMLPSVKRGIKKKLPLVLWYNWTPCVRENCTRNDVDKTTNENTVNCGTRSRRTHVHTHTHTHAHAVRISFDVVGSRWGDVRWTVPAHAHAHARNGGTANQYYTYAYAGRAVRSPAPRTNRPTPARATSVTGAAVYNAFFYGGVVEPILLLPTESRGRFAVSSASNLTAVARAFLLVIYPYTTIPNISFIVLLLLLCRHYLLFYLCPGNTLQIQYSTLYIIHVFWFWVYEQYTFVVL